MQFITFTVRLILEIYRRNDSNGGELFGWSWAQKHSDPSEQQKATEQQDIAEQQSGENEPESPEQY